MKIGGECAKIMNAWPHPIGDSPRIFSATIVTIALNQVMGPMLKKVREVYV